MNTHTIAVCHGAGAAGNTEASLSDRFSEADCFIYGHTHRPVIIVIDNVVNINPGSFMSTGCHGSSGTYAILETSETGIKAVILSLPQER